MIFAFVLGAVFGSFCKCLNDRFCAQKPLFLARSFCFSCDKKLKFFELIPIFSYIFLKYKCKNCGAKIKFSIFLAEILGAIFGILAFFLSANLLEFILLFFLIFLLFFLSLMDLRLKAVSEILLWFCFFLCFFVAQIFDFSSAFELQLLNFENKILKAFLNAFFFAGFIFLLKSFVSFVKYLFKNNGKIRENLGDADIILLAGFAFFGLDFAFFTLFLAALFALPIFLIQNFKKIHAELAFIPFLSFSFLCVFALLKTNQGF